MNKENDMTYLTNREAALHLCNGGKLEFRRNDGTWCQSVYPLVSLVPDTIDTHSQYRAAVETFQITVRGVTFDVPEPVREPLKVDQRYWAVNPDAENYTCSYHWDGDESDFRWLERGLIHLTEAAAVTHAKAPCGVK